MSENTSDQALPSTAKRATQTHNRLTTRRWCTFLKSADCWTFITHSRCPTGALSTREASLLVFTDASLGVTMA